MASSEIVRFRNTAGRLLVELLYGEASWMERGGGTVKYPLTKFALALQMRPSKQIDALQWLSVRGFIKKLSIGRTHITLEMVSPLGFKSCGEQLTPSEYAPALDSGELPWRAT